MDTKTPLPPPAFDGDEPAPPPSYTESASTSTTSHYSTQIRSQLSALTARITSLQTQKALLSHAQDEKILSLLTFAIQNYLSDFANSGVQKGSLILVPEKGLDNADALPSGYDSEAEDEYDRVVRIGGKSDSDGFSDNEGALMFWHDEDMAIRLAAYLRPPPEHRKLELPPRNQNAVAQPSEQKSRGFWGSRKKSVTKPPLTPVERQSSDVKKVGANSEPDDKVILTVNADEVVFRTENEYGLYETRRGWGVVLKLRVILAGDRR